MKLILGKFLSLLTVVWCWNSQVYASSYGKYINELENQFVKEMAKYGFHCTSSGGGTAYDVKELSIGFAIKEKGSIELGREKIIFLTERYLEAINNHEKIRPYLREYPFPDANIMVSLSFKQSNGHPYEDGSVSLICHVRNKIFYMGEDPNNKYKSIDLFEEDYEEALGKINKINAVPTEIKTHKVVVAPTKKRLGTLVTDLSKFTPGMVLEALGNKISMDNENLLMMLAS